MAGKLRGRISRWAMWLCRAEPQPKPKSAARQRASEANFFLMKELSVQGATLPGLATKYNELLKQPSFYSRPNGRRSGILVITGNREDDALLAKNMHRMRALEARIGLLGIGAERIRNQGRAIDAAKRIADGARALESKLGALRKENSAILRKAFPKKIAEN